MDSCVHINSKELNIPSDSHAVYREDCTQCFDSVDHEAGLNVCLTCFNGGCAGERNHGLLHFRRSGHPLALNIKRRPKKHQRDEPPQKISKLAILEEREEDRYDTLTRVVCYDCLVDDVDKSTGDLPAVIEGVMKAMTFSKKEEVKAWEQEFVPCDHTLSLSQDEPKQIRSQDLGQCSMCSLKQNLWLCLECGNLGCGRSQFGGIGGNSHALAHSETTSHAVAVKLGSITADGSADIYCYKCNEERIDPDLAPHLAHWGINILAREKTEKSLMEMQLEHNLKWDFAMTTQDGHELTPVIGPGFTGLTNLGNSCYLSSVLQCIFDLPEFQLRYYRKNDEPPFTQLPAEDLETQMRKIADGILSGRYSQADMNTSAASDSPEIPHRKGLAPTMFKHLIGRGHGEFSTMRQQDAFEFLLHVFKIINLAKHQDGGGNPIKAFNFSMEQRLQCLSCKKVRYRVDGQDNVSIPVPAHRLTSNESDSFSPVTLYECLDAFTSEEIVQLDCPSCKSKDGFAKCSSFRTLPQHLVVNARRFELVNWVPTKLEVPLEVSDGTLDFSRYLSKGQQADEELLPDMDERVSFTPNDIVLDQLLGMGFPRARCEKSLYMTGNADAETAMNWLFAHMDDDDIDEPISGLRSEESSDTWHDAAQVAQLSEMGIDEPRAKKALAATGGDVVRAIDWVFSHPDIPIEDDNGTSDVASSSQPRVLGYETTPARYQLRSIICHKGSSVHAGHYVAFIRKPLPDKDGFFWVMFNDEKVVKVDDVQEMKKYAYLYFFSRV